MSALTKKALNRALLARQMLLRKEELSPLRVVEQLLGLQAQQARPPFVGLWARLAKFSREDLLELIASRKIVRATAMRATLHLMSAKDYLQFRSSLQPALTAAMRSVMKSRKSEAEIDEIVAAAARCFAEQAQTFGDLRVALSQQFPDADERMMGYLARTQLPLVMVPEEAEFGFGTDSKFTLASGWLKKTVGTEERMEDLLLRYLATFGPATVADAQAWSGLPKLKPVFEALRPKLEVFRDERKRELFDVPGALLPPEDTPAPVRFLPGFDNVILAHADRTRIIADEYRPRVATKNLQILPTFLVDGFVAGTWDYTFVKKSAVLSVSPFKKFERAAKRDLAEAGELLVRFLAPDAGHSEVTFQEAG